MWESSQPGYFGCFGWKRVIGLCDSGATQTPSAPSFPSWAGLVLTRRMLVGGQFFFTMYGSRAVAEEYWLCLSISVSTALEWDSVLTPPTLFPIS